MFIRKAFTVFLVQSEATLAADAELDCSTGAGSRTKRLVPAAPRSGTIRPAPRKPSPAE